ncbi:hypothetical protein [Haliangium sp.]|uniref:hypothetical protein n=1 Tax=Haliangium sp. TaxID=2663208 RepID=UPI003D0D3918
MSPPQKFVSGWMFLSAILVLLFTILTTMAAPAAGLINDLWLLPVGYLPAIATGLIVGMASKDNRNIETACGFVLFAFVSAVVSAAAQVLGGTTPSLLLVPGLLVHAGLGGGLAFGTAALGRRYRMREPRGWRIE